MPTAETPTEKEQSKLHAHRDLLSEKIDRTIKFVDEIRTRLQEIMEWTPPMADAKAEAPIKEQAGVVGAFDHQLDRLTAINNRLYDTLEHLKKII